MSEAPSSQLEPIDPEAISEAYEKLSLESQLYLIIIASSDPRTGIIWDRENEAHNDLADSSLTIIEDRREIAEKFLEANQEAVYALQQKLSEVEMTLRARYILERRISDFEHSLLCLTLAPGVLKFLVLKLAREFETPPQHDDQ